MILKLSHGMLLGPLSGRSSNSNLTSPAQSSSVASPDASVSMKPVVPRTIDFTRDDSTVVETPEGSKKEEPGSDSGSVRSDSMISDSNCGDSLSNCSAADVNESGDTKKGPLAGLKNFLDEQKLSPPKAKLFFNNKAKNVMTPLQERQKIQQAQQRAFLKEKGIIQSEHNAKESIEERQALQRAKQIAFLQGKGLMGEGGQPIGLLSDAA